MKTLSVILPASALVVDSGTEPRVGDVIDLQGKARIENIQDGRARLVIETLNDTEPEVAEGADDADETEPDEDDGMAAAAEKADKEAYL